MKRTYIPEWRLSGQIMIHIHALEPPGNPAIQQDLNGLQAASGLDAAVFLHNNGATGVCGHKPWIPYNEEWDLTLT